MSKLNESQNQINTDQTTIISGFVKECCILGKDKRVRGVDLHNKYMEYAKEKAISPLELIDFYKELDKVCGKQIVKSRWFEGRSRVRGLDGIDIK